MHFFLSQYLRSGSSYPEEVKWRFGSPIFSGMNVVDVIGHDHVKDDSDHGKYQNHSGTSGHSVGQIAGREHVGPIDPGDC